MAKERVAATRRRQTGMWAGMPEVVRGGRWDCGWEEGCVDVGS